MELSLGLESHSDVARLLGAVDADGLLDLVEFGLDFGRKLVIVGAEASQDREGFVAATGLEEPTGRFRHEEGGDGEADEGTASRVIWSGACGEERRVEERDEHKLESDREAPADLGVASADEGESVLCGCAHVSKTLEKNRGGAGHTEPVSDDDSGDVQRELEGDEETAGEVTGRLGGPHGHDRVEVARATAGYHPRYDHPLKVLRRGLQRGADENLRATDVDGLLASKLVADPAAEQAANKGAQVIRADDTPLEEDTARCARVSGEPWV